MTKISSSWPVWFLVRGATRDNPVSIAAISEQTGLSARAVKAAIESLRRDGQPIGACRGNRNGYYLVRSAEDGEAAAVPMVRQAVAMLRTAKAMLPAARYRELLGQQVFE